MRRIGFCWVFVLVVSNAFSQTVFSNTSPSVDWKYIDSDRFRLIFSETFAPNAAKTTSSLVLNVKNVLVNLGLISRF